MLLLHQIGIGLLTNLHSASVSSIYSIYILLHRLTCGFSVDKVCSVEAPVFAPLVKLYFIRFPVFTALARHCSVELPVSAPLVWFAPLNFQCLLRWHGLLR